MELRKRSDEPKIVIELPESDALDRALDAHRRGGRKAMIKELRKIDAERTKAAEQKPSEPPR
jgi:hypothetical protein